MSRICSSHVSHVNLPVYIYINLHMHISTYIFIYIYIHTYIYIHILCVWTGGIFDCWKRCKRRDPGPWRVCLYLFIFERRVEK